MSIDKLLQLPHLQLFTYIGTAIAFYLATPKEMDFLKNIWNKIKPIVTHDLFVAILLFTIGIIVLIIEILNRFSHSI